MPKYLAVFACEIALFEIERLNILLKILVEKIIYNILLTLINNRLAIVY